jgi:Fe-S-cluster containining protein
VPGTTDLAPTDSLPLTCSRDGACCFGKTVWLTPWELARLAWVKGLSPRIFRDRYCEFGGIRLRFDGAPDSNGAACSQYIPDRGCSVHAGRPLVCRLYPLGRKRCGNNLTYVHLGNRFPCEVSCPAVLNLPYLTVTDYLAVQDVSAGEMAQDKYLELMQRLADAAFALLFESGLASTGDRLTLRLWRELGSDDPQQSAQRLGPEWIDRLMVPDIHYGLDDPEAFADRHHEMLRSQAQESFGDLGDDAAALREASGFMMGLSLHLGRGLGINPAELVERWIVAAQELGAR